MTFVLNKSTPISVIERTKRFFSKPCTKCKKDIPVGEKYISTFYNDGFVNKPVGLYHKKCWNKIQKELK